MTTRQLWPVCYQVKDTQEKQHPPLWNARGQPPQKRRSPPSPQTVHMSSLPPVVICCPFANDVAIS